MIPGWTWKGSPGWARLPSSGNEYLSLRDVAGIFAEISVFSDEARALVSVTTFGDELLGVPIFLDDLVSVTIFLDDLVDVTIFLDDLVGVTVF